jgi:hypothetical protein
MVGMFSLMWFRTFLLETLDYFFQLTKIPELEFHMSGNFATGRSETFEVASVQKTDSIQMWLFIRMGLENLMTSRYSQPGIMNIFESKLTFLSFQPQLVDEKIILRNYRREISWNRSVED